MRKIFAGIITLAVAAFVSYKMGYKSGVSQIDEMATENKVKSELVELTRQVFSLVRQKEMDSVKTL